MVKLRGVETKKEILPKLEVKDGTSKKYVRGRAHLWGSDTEAILC